MIKIEIPADNYALAALIGDALSKYGRADLDSIEGVTQYDSPAVVRELAERTAVATSSATGVGEQTDDDSQQQADTRVDQNGVVFDPQYCGEAAEPFYGSGKREGQWKKKRGVADADYDAWYATQRAGAAPATDAPIDTSGAFSSTQQPAAPAGAPTDTGAFMTWVSERIVAGNLTQEQVGAAYGEHGLTVTDLFPPNAPEVIAANIAKLHGSLSQ